MGSFSLRYYLALFAAVSSLLHADIDIHEGMWEIKGSIESSGLPIQIPEQKTSQCITRQNSIPQTNSEVAKYCQVAEQKIEGNTISWKMQCKNNIQSDGTISYRGDTFDGFITVHTQIPQLGSVKMTTRVEGVRTGECR